MTAAHAGRDSVRLDVRPLLAEGIEPLDTILRAAEAVRPGGVLELTAPFEPTPLYGVLRERGFTHETEQHASTQFVVRFTQTGITPDRTLAELARAGDGVRAALAAAGLDVECDGARTLRYAAWTAGAALQPLLAALQTAATAES